MRYLLDTQAFIWLDSNQEKLTERVITICRDSSHELFLSIASVWEMQIKMKLGKLILPIPLAQTISDQQMTNGIQLLPITLEHILILDSLPDYHKDPFDRLLIAQTQVEQLILITSDSKIGTYPISTIWS